MVIEMFESKNCLDTIEQNLQTKEKFLASLHLQDKVLSCLLEFSEISRSFAWGYLETITKNALYRINNLVFQQLLIPGVIGIDLYKIWHVTSECLPIIKDEVNLWANSKCDFKELSDR